MNRNYLVSDTRSLRCRGQHSCCNARAADKHKQMNPNTMFDTPAYIQREVVCWECVCLPSSLLQRTQFAAVAADRFMARHDDDALAP